MNRLRERKRGRKENRHGMMDRQYFSAFACFYPELIQQVCGMIFGLPANKITIEFLKLKRSGTQLPVGAKKAA